MFKSPIKILMAPAIVIAIALGIFFIIELTSPEPTAPQTIAVQQYAPPANIELPLVQLEGKWRAEYNGTVFAANVVDDTIRINLVSADGSYMIYWNGTFKTSESSGHSFASRAIEIDEIVLSQVKSKDFVIGKDSMSFEFKAMGVTKIVELKRG